MGIIRKTMSISTLGIVSFRSKKELLRRSERDRRSAETELSREQAARADADRRIAAAERRVQQAELGALHNAKISARAKAKRKDGRGGRRARKAAKAIAGDIADRTTAAAHKIKDLTEAARTSD